MAKVRVVTIRRIRESPCPYGHSHCLSARCWLGDPVEDKRKALRKSLARFVATMRERGYTTDQIQAEIVKTAEEVARVLDP